MANDPEYFSDHVVSTRRFWIPQPDLATGLGVLSGGFEHVAMDYRIERDGFPEAIVELVAGGEGVLTLAGRDYRLAPGLLFTYGPGVPVRMVTDPRAVLRKYFLTVTGPAAAALLAAAHLAPGQAATVADPQPYGAILDQAIACGQGAGAGRGRACAIAAEYLLQRLAGEALPVDAADSRALATFRRCHQAIERRFLEVRTQAGIAALAGIEPSYLCRLYRRYAQESPYQHLRRLRLHHALGRLHAGASVAAVAAEVGFADPAHFSRAFQQCFGLPPSRARRGGPVR